MITDHLLVEIALTDGSFFLTPQLRISEIPQSLQNTDTALSFSVPRLLKETTLIPANLNDVDRFSFNLFQRD